MMNMSSQPPTDGLVQRLAALGRISANSFVACSSGVFEMKIDVTHYDQLGVVHGEPFEQPSDSFEKVS